jgi:hypothetical protein
VTREKEEMIGRNDDFIKEMDDVIRGKEDLLTERTN